MPALSNAERQRRHRQRVSDQLSGDASETTRLRNENVRLREAFALVRRSRSAIALDEQQERQFQDIVADLTSDRAWWRRSRTAPATFMGYTRDQWLMAPAELIAFFGLTDAVANARVKMRRSIHSNLEQRARRLSPKDRVTWT
jgi:hypothetical protein